METDLTAKPLEASLTLGGYFQGDLTGNPMTFDGHNGTPGTFNWAVGWFGGDTATGLTANVALSAALTGVSPYVDAPGTVETLDATHYRFHLPNLPGNNSSAPIPYDHFGFTGAPTASGSLTAIATLTADEKIIDSSHHGTMRELADGQGRHQRRAGQGFSRAEGRTRRFEWQSDNDVHAV